MRTVRGLYTLGGLSAIALLAGCGGGSSNNGPVHTGPPAGTATYDISDLGAPPGFTSARALKINDSGIVIAEGTNTSVLIGDTIGTTASATTFSIATTPKPGTWVQTGSVTAYDINAAGLVVGTISANAGAGTGPFPAFYSNGTVTQLNPTDPNQQTGFTVLTALNDNAYAVGYSYTTSSSVTTPIFYTPANTGNVPTPGGYAPTTVTGGTFTPVAINNSLAIAGTLVSGATTSGVIYQNGTVTNVGSINTAATETTPRAINSNGVIVGRTGKPGAYHGFTYNPASAGTKLVDIGTLAGTSSEAYAVNDAGQVVGTSQTAAPTSTATQPYRAFILSVDVNAGKDLNTLIDTTTQAAGWVLESANSINRKGEIVGLGTLNGVRHVYKLTPR